MTLSEFKAWFEGFTEDMDGSPNAKQWKRIQQRIKAVNDVRITERIYRDWWPSERPYRYLGLSTETLSARSSMSLCAEPPSGDIGRIAFAKNDRPMDGNDCRPVDIVAELRALGKADADSLKAA